MIVNKPSTHPLSEIFTDHERLKQGKDVLFFGGPVMPASLVFLARAPKAPPRSVPVLKDVYFTGDADWIDERLGQPGTTRNLRVYAGYAGWGPGQLQNEMRRGDWYVLPASAAMVFDRDPAEIWTELIRQAATKQTRGEDDGPSSLITHRSNLSQK